MTSYRFDRFEIRPTERRLLVDGQPASLGARAFDLLLALVERCDRTVTKNELLDLVWAGLVVEENNLQVQISTLRKVLGQDAIATIPAQGYHFTLRREDGQASPSATAREISSRSAASTRSRNGAAALVECRQSAPERLEPRYERD